MNATEYNACMQAIGWSQHELARRLGVSPGKTKRWGNGQYPVPRDVARWLQRVARWIHANPPPPQAPVRVYATLSPPMRPSP